MSDADRARRASSFDVIEIGRGGADGGAAPGTAFKRAGAPAPRRAEKRMRYLWTLLACALHHAACCTLLAPAFDLANVAMLYMLTVVLAGVQWGRGPAIVAAMLNVVAFDFFFVPPRFSLVPADSSTTSPSR